jgi:nicotinate-nucleotide pyrophosphorylase (carboxylating)
LIVEPLIRAALLEDVAHGGDLTTDAIVEPGLRTTARIAARQPGVIAGVEAALWTFQALDREAVTTVVVPDGSRVDAGGTVAEISASARAMLTGERTALNFLCRLSGIATATRAMADIIAGTRARVADTRKTTPGLRSLEKYAVRCGGGSNHRFGLDDAVLIKDNHLALAGSIHAAVAAVRAHVGHLVKVEVEVDTLEQLREALDEPIDAVLLDNMNLEQLAEAVRLAAGKGKLTEASGGINRATIRAVAETGVDLISMGSLTHSSPALDLGLDISLSSA